MDIRKPSDLQKMVKQNAYPGDTEQILQRAAKLLADLLQEEVDSYYSSYSPVSYRRTESFRKSIRISPVKIEKYGKNEYRMNVSVYFDNEMATHPSIFNGEDGFVPILLNEGFSWKSKKGPYRLAYYEGFKFIQRAINRFRRDKWSNGIIVRVDATHNGRSIDGLDGEY